MKVKFKTPGSFDHGDSIVNKTANQAYLDPTGIRSVRMITITYSMMAFGIAGTGRVDCRSANEKKRTGPSYF